MIAIVPYSILVIGRKGYGVYYPNYLLKMGTANLSLKEHATTPQKYLGCSCLHDGFRCLFWHSLSRNKPIEKELWIGLYCLFFVVFAVCPVWGGFTPFTPNPGEMIQFDGCIFFNGVGEQPPTRKEIHFWSSPLPIWLIVIYTPVIFHIAMENGPLEDVWIVLKIGIFQPAMLVYQRVILSLELL